MATPELKITCQRCGEQMEMKDPAPGDPWRADQFWVCPRCGRHFWSTYPAPAVAAPAAAAPSDPPAAAAAKV
jgi:rRNA maturation protein Nop10